MLVQQPLLQLQGVAKRFRAGIAGCTASVRVLERVDLEVLPEECVALQGGRGAGKTTLLLCAAGLLKPDVGKVHMREPSTAHGSRCTVQYMTGRDELLEHRTLTSPTVLLIDETYGAVSPVWTAEMEALLARIRRDGGAIVIVGGDDIVRRNATRTIHLARGRLFTVSRRLATDSAPARVAEDDQQAMRIR
jgi:ribose transport system ATP-binding protein